MHTVAREGVQAVLVSGLITSVIPQVRQVRGALAAKGLAGLKVVAGGAVLKQASPKNCRWIMWAQTALTAPITSIRP